ncbi:MAG TPA: hypothetical protein VKA43_03755 [Gammaproteobacteria bacterium]|nr:hypothetical protein [Gammaproteobacteria bacterium]
MRKATLAVIGGLALAGVASSQVQWNERPLADGVFREYAADYRTDVIDIPLAAGEELEYKLGLNEGDSIVYQWDAVDLEDPEVLWSEFHGHTPPVNNVGDLMFYRKAYGATERGVLVAPFSGIHGWYLRNDGDKALVVRLKVAGFYELQ